MSPPSPFPRLPVVRASDGFTLIEAMIAGFVLTVGIIGLLTAFGSSQKLTLRSERRSVMAHRAQLEIERLQAYPYSELAMITAPGHSGEKTNPDYYVAGSEYQWDPASASKEALDTATTGECTEPVAKGCGVVAASPSGRKCSEHLGPCEWVDGLITGSIYDFVTWHTDGHCGGRCLTKEDYKRLTVVVTTNVPSSNQDPGAVRVSTLITEPS